MSEQTRLSTLEAAPVRYKWPRFRVIHVKLDPSTGSLDYSDEANNPAHEKESHRDSEDGFQWRSDSGDLEISFPDGHPFHEHPGKSRIGRATKPVHVKSDAEARKYKYNVTLIDQHGVRHDDDPFVVIHTEGSAHAFIQAHSGLDDPAFHTGLDEPGIQAHTGLDDPP